MQSLLAALQDKAAGEESGDGLPGVSDKKRPFPSPPLLPQPSSMMTGAVVSKRARCTTATVGATPKAYSSSVNRFLERREAGDFAWLHQLGSEEYDKVSSTAGFHSTAPSLRTRRAPIMVHDKQCLLLLENANAAIGELGNDVAVPLGGAAT